jgi:hypothetical protein
VYDTANCTCSQDADCDDSNPCTDDACNMSAGTCTNTPNAPNPCDDGSECTENDACQGDGSCTGTPVDCDDGDQCTLDGCDPAIGCYFQINAGVPCDDGDPCTVGEMCDGSGMCLGNPKNCDDSNSCTTDACDPADGSCIHTALPGTPCDDGDMCTVGDVCQANGACTGTPKNCNDVNQCTADSCDPATGNCQHEITPGMICNDRDHCTVGDMCDDAGDCIGNPKNCDDSLQCTIDSCNPADGSCINMSQTGAPCDDGDVCTAGDRCQADGTCVGSPVDCDDGDQCTGDSCEPVVGCVSIITPGVPCDDGDLCTEMDMCDNAGLCMGTLKDCDDSNECTDDFCDGATGDCYVAPLAGMPCDDGDPCTVNDVCDGAGNCVGDKIVDANEPDDDVGLATLLGNITDDEAYPAGTASGTISPQADNDWFYYNVRDVPMGNLQPTVELNNIPSGNDYDLCVFYECVGGSGVTLSCIAGTLTSAHGMQGCCSTNSGSSSEIAILSPDCDGTVDNSGSVYVEVSWISGPGNCTDYYSLPWGDD